MNKFLVKKSKIVTITICSALVCALLTVSIFLIINNKVKSSAQEITLKDYNKDDERGKVGYGYNAISGDYTNMEGISSRNNIFAKRVNDSTREKVIDDTVITVDRSYTKGNTYIINGKDSSEFYNNFQAQLSNKTSVAASGDVLPVSLNMFLEANTKFEKGTTTGKVTEYIKTISEPIIGLVSWHLDESQYYDYLDETFKNDLLTMDSKKLFDKYGTHFFTSYLIGGRLEIDAMVSANTYEQLKNVTSAYKLSVEAEGTVEGVDVNGKTEFGSDMAIKDQDTINSSDIETTAEHFGGKDCDFKGYANMLADRVLAKKETTDLSNKETVEIYQNWLGTLEEKPVIVNVYDQNSLYPIWELLLLFPANETWTEEALLNRAIELEDAYKAAQRQYAYEMESKINNLKNEEKAVCIDTKTICVQDMSSYDRNQQITDDQEDINKNYKLGNFYVSGATRSQNNDVIIKSGDAKVIYNLAQDKKNLPKGETKNLRKHALISDCTLTMNVDGYGDTFRYCMLFEAGAYVQVTYKNMNTEKAVRVLDLLNKKNKGDSIEICTIDSEKIRDNGGISNIRVGLLYRTKATYGEGIKRYNRFYKWLDEGSIDIQ